MEASKGWTILSLQFNNVAQVSKMAHWLFLITKSQPSEMSYTNDFVVIKRADLKYIQNDVCVYCSSTKFFVNKL